MSTVRQALDAARRQLTALTDADPELDAQVLLAHLLGRDRSWLYAWPDATLDATQQAIFERLIARRAAGEPVAHLTGQREFWGLPLAVSADTLIPRPDTELLVEMALDLGDAGQPLKVLDLGTGSGAIALALARERPTWHITASDTSGAALTIAQRNAATLGLSRVHFRQGDWFAAIEPDQRFDLILSNPPYIAAQDPHLQQGDVRHEPRSALVAGAEGLDDIRILTAQAPHHLEPGGWLLLEHGYDQGPETRELLRQAGFDCVETREDLAGRPRVSIGQYQGHP